jgi:hypothetical protein
MAKAPPWSYSSLSAYENCPKRYQLTRVTKVIVEPPTDATIWGNRVHQALENYVKDGTPLPDGMEQWEHLGRKIRDSEGIKFTEQKLAITADFQPSDWDSPDTWCRCIVDVGVIQDKRIIALDWKTGKRKTDTDQLRMSAGILFAHYPDTEVVDTGYVWLKVHKIDVHKFTRTDIADIWNVFLPRTQRLVKAYAEDVWNPKPSGLCKNWCPVGRVNCGYCGR